MNISPQLLVALLGTCVMVGGCGSTHPPPAPDSAAELSGDLPSETVVHEPLRAVGGRPQPTAASWHDEFSQLSASQQAFVQSVNARYFGSLVAADDKEAAWLARSGFPSARQVAEYAALTEDELAERAARGSNLDRLMYADRLADNISRLKAELAGDVATTEPLEFAKLTALRNAGHALRDRSNVFATYVYGQVDYRITESTGSIAGGMMMATQRGDRRTSMYAMEMERNRPVSVAVTMTIYQGMLRVERERPR